MTARHPFCPRTATLLGLCLILGACTGLHNARPAVTETPPRQAPVELTRPPLGPVRVSTYTDLWQREVYALYAGDHGARAELIYAQATATNTALEYPRYGLHRLTESWNLNRGGLAQWGPVAHLQTGSRVFFYAPFRPAAANRQCVSFGSDWALTADDPRQRPGKAMFGYFCAAPGHQLDKAMIDRLLTGIRVPATPAPPGADSVAVPDPGPGATGNARFPFAFARHYNVGDGAQFM